MRSLPGNTILVGLSKGACMGGVVRERDFLSYCGTVQDKARASAPGCQSLGPPKQPYCRRAIDSDATDASIASSAYAAHMAWHGMGVPYVA